MRNGAKIWKRNKSDTWCCICAMRLLKELFNRYKFIVAYLFFGVCSTVVNIVAYYVCARSFSLATGLSTAVAWFFAVIFAYITNKLWVFESKSWKRDVVIKEAVSFFACRLATGIFDVVFMMVTVDVFELNDLWMKIISNVVVVIVNYIASKFVIFRNSRK